MKIREGDTRKRKSTLSARILMQRTKSIIIVKDTNENLLLPQTLVPTETKAKGEDTKNSDRKTQWTEILVKKNVQIPKIVSCMI